ncbi:MAG: HD domain-containing protein [Lachnospiraceae bacterium]|nr:HD domain-containing protein [Lachnospiraceae bacterium]
MKQSTKNIFRQTHLSGHGRNENDAEHAWHMAIMAYLLREYSNEPVDISKVMLMCLIHEFEENETAEARYAHAMDNLQPLMLNDSNGGSDWKEHGVSFLCHFTSRSPEEDRRSEEYML